MVSCRWLPASPGSIITSGIAVAQSSERNRFHQDAHFYLHLLERTDHLYARTATGIRNHIKKVKSICIYFCASIYTIWFHSNFLDETGKPSAYISFFYKPWNHANVFFVGFIFGAFIYRANLKKYALQKVRYHSWSKTIMLIAIFYTQFVSPNCRAPSIFCGLSPSVDTCFASIVRCHGFLVDRMNRYGLRFSFHSMEQCGR